MAIHQYLNEWTYLSGCIGGERGIDLELFWPKVDKTNTCWNWKAAKDRGYGKFNQNKVNYYAHRISYEFFKGKIPSDKEIDHLCRNRGCVNPAHLEAVTHKINDLRGFGVSAINNTKTNCPKGHPYSGENLVVDKQGRRCKICNKEKQKRNFERNHHKWNETRRMKRRLNKTELN